MTSCSNGLNQKRRNAPLSACAALALSALGAAGILCVQAAMPSASGLVPQAHADWKGAYEKTLSKIYRSENISGYRYLDIAGSKTKELLVCSWTNRAAIETYRIYTYKNGKAKRLWADTFYGVSKFWFYKKTKSFRMEMEGHGGNSLWYYKMKGGKYKRVLCKARGMKPGTESYGSWDYYTNGNKKISKSSFNRQAKKLTRGKAQATVPYRWNQY